MKNVKFNSLHNLEMQQVDVLTGQSQEQVWKASHHVLH